MEQEIENTFREDTVVMFQEAPHMFPGGHSRLVEAVAPPNGQRGCCDELGSACYKCSDLDCRKQPPSPLHCGSQMLWAANSQSDVVPAQRAPK